MDERTLRRIVREEIAPLAKAFGALGSRKEAEALAARERAERKRQDRAGAEAVRRYRERRSQQGSTS